MRPTRVILAVILVVVAILFQIADMLQNRIQDTNVIVISGMVICALVWGAYIGPRWFRWIPGVITALFALASTIEGTDMGSTYYVIAGVCFAAASWMVFSIRNRSSESANQPMLAPLEQDLYITEETSPPAEVTTQYPYLSTRIKSAFIDQMLVLFSLMVVMITTKDFEHGTAVKIVAAIILMIFYEPLLTVHSATLGQRLMGIRVRSANDPTRKINFFQSVLRHVFKLALGWLSLVVIHSNKERRAIHDLAAGSVVVEASVADVSVAGLE